MRALAAALAALPLAGCLTIATINVDGRHAKTYVVTFGGVHIGRTSGDALRVKQTDLGLFAACGGAGVGVSVCAEARAQPRSNTIVILSERKATHAPIDHPLRSAGGRP